MGGRRTWQHPQRSLDSFSQFPHRINLLPSVVPSIAISSSYCEEQQETLQNLEKLGKKARDRSERSKEAKRGAMMPGEGG